MIPTHSHVKLPALPRLVKKRIDVLLLFENPLFQDTKNSSPRVEVPAESSLHIAINTLQLIGKVTSLYVF